MYDYSEPLKRQDKTTAKGDQLVLLNQKPSTTIRDSSKQELPIENAKMSSAIYSTLKYKNSIT